MARGVLSSFKSNIGNPLKAYLFDVVIPNPIGGGNVDALRFRVQTTELPGRSYDFIHIDYQGTAGANYAGRERFDQEWTMTIAEGQDLAVYSSVQKWLDEMKTGDDIGNKTDVYLTLIGANDSNALRVRLIGAWIKSRGKLALSVKSSDPVNFDITFQFDEVKDISVGNSNGLLSMVKSLAKSVIGAL